MDDPAQPVSVEEYKQLELREHIRNIPDTYLGSDAWVKRGAHLWNPETESIYYSEITVPMAMERTFIEIISNTADNVTRSRHRGVNPGKIEVHLSSTMIVIRNQGLPIAVDYVDESEGLYLPEMIFGRFLTSSNYNTERIGNGRNGYGAKLTNVFSKFFQVTVGDNYHKKLYKQAWYDGMSVREDPVIKSYSGAPFVEIKYCLDFERFECDSYPEEALQLFYRHAVDVAFTTKAEVHVTVYDDSELEDVADWSTSLPKVVQSKYKDLTIKEYTSFHHGKDAKAIYYSEWPEGTEVKGKPGSQKAKDTTPLFEFAAVDTSPQQDADGREVHMSFINGIHTFSGGVHLRHLVKTLYPMILSEAREILEGKKRKSSSVKLTSTHIHPHVSLIFSCWMKNPKFSSQMKDFLTDPAPKFKLPPEIAAPVRKWELVLKLQQNIESRMEKKLKSTDGKKRLRIITDNAIQSRYVYSGRRGAPGPLVLCAVEGKSAGGYTKVLAEKWPDKYCLGYIPFRGVPLNVMNASAEQLLNNEEFKLLKASLGLVEGTDYTDEKQLRKLFYDRFIIIADKDADGAHIAGLILLYFFCRFPSLLKVGFVSIMHTPIVSAYSNSGKDRKHFYSEKEFRRWHAKHGSGYKVKYRKGLGSSSEKDIEDELRDGIRITTVVHYDDKDTDAMRLAFDIKRSSDRRDWLQKWSGQATIPIEDIEEISLSEFINEEYIRYPWISIVRSLPSIDGFKDAPRKVLYTTFKHWGVKKQSLLSKLRKSDEKNLSAIDLLTSSQKVVNTAKEFMKTGRFANKTAQETDYAHGENNLNGVIQTMTHAFVGSNNMPFFKAEGMMGTRSRGGKDAADPRYTQISPSEWLNYVFKANDIDLTGYRNVNGEDTEFNWALPIIPLHVINGVEGISFAYSSWIPPHHPLEVIAWLRQWLHYYDHPTEEEMFIDEIYPYYHGFKGKITVVEKVNKDGTTKNSLVTEGCYTRDGRGKITITELPIGLWGSRYHKKLGKLLEEKKITDFHVLNHTDMNSFEIHGWIGEVDTKTLGIKKTYSLDYMRLLDADGHVRRYESISELLNGFAEWRIKFFAIRRDIIKQDIEAQLQECKDYIKLVKAVRDGELIVFDPATKRVRARSDILEDVKRLGISEGIYSKTKLEQLDLNGITHLERAVEYLEQQLKEIDAITAAKLWDIELEQLETYLKQTFKPREKEVEVITIGEGHEEHKEEGEEGEEHEEEGEEE